MVIFPFSLTLLVSEVVRVVPELIWIRMVLEPHPLDIRVAQPSYLFPLIVAVPSSP
jgi:hypothetical protein